jgi:hypothetical protein
MRIKKTFQGSLPENTVVNTQSDSQINAYSCEYANNNFKSKMENILSSQGQGQTFQKSLTKAYTNFDFLIIMWSPWGTDASVYDMSIPTAIISNSVPYEDCAYQNSSVYKGINVTFPDTSTIKLNTTNAGTWPIANTTLIAVYGVKL